MNDRAVLELTDLRRHFGGVRAVDGVSLRVERGSIAGLIGPNGAGKTTLINVVAGQLVPDGGDIRLNGAPIGGRRPHRIAALGVARTFQNIRLYRDLTPVENVVTGMHIHRGRDGLSRLLPRRHTAADRARIEEAKGLLDLVGLDQERVTGRPARTLPYGDQRRLEIARALALKPQLLLLDEPAAGMNATEKERLRALLKELNASGLTILLVDHDIKLVMGVCDQVTVINFGRQIAHGEPTVVAADEAVITAYLGSERDDPSTHRADRVPLEAARPAPPPERVLLDVEHLAVSYGAVRAVEDVTFQVGVGEVVTLIGANGAGKTTVLSTLSGLLRATNGTARYGDLDLTTASSQSIVKAGLVQVPEGREILARLSVEENLSLGGWTRTDRAGVSGDIAAMLERFPILGERRRLAAGQLSGGEQQMLAIARALIARPRLLLMDEPSLGLAPRLVEQVFSLIEQIRAEGITVLLVEQNARAALELADRAYVIETGRVVLSGTGEALRHDPQVQRAYLGT